MKKAVAALCCAAFLIVGSLSACSASKTALTVGEAEIDREVYLYFLDQAMREMKKQLPPTADSDISTTVEADSVQAESAASSPNTAQSPVLYTPELLERAEELCAEYVAVNTLFAQYGCSLTEAEKSGVSVSTNNLWRLYGRYYESIGVSKQTLYKAEWNHACQSAVITALYGENGQAPVPEEEIKKYYEDNHIVFRAISGYYTDLDEDGNSIPMSGEKRAETDASFASMAEKINGGTDINTVYNEYLKSQGYEEANESLEIRIASPDSKGYPAGFFDAVHALEINKAGVIQLEGYIYVILRLDPYTEDSLYYIQNKNDVLEGLKGEDFQLLVQQQAKGYTVVPNEQVQQACLKKIVKRNPSISFA